MDGVKDCVQRLLRNEILPCTSTATSGEVLEGNLTAEQRDRYNLVFKGRRSLLPWAPKIDPIAKHIREYYLVRKERVPSLTDAQHLAYAIHYEVDAFHTFDEGQMGGCSLLALDGNVAGYALRVCKPPVEQMRLDLGPLEEIKN